jgi:hypothetical protein
MVCQTKQRRRWMRSNVGRYFDSPRPRTRTRRRRDAAARAHQDADGFSARARYKIGMREMRAELIDCHDCRRPVSFRALNCPHCGSTEPTGPYAFSKKEARRFRVEQRNDHMLVVTTVACTGAGALCGILGSSSTLGAILAGIGYGAVGLLIGVPIGFAINLTRRLIR